MPLKGGRVHSIAFVAALDIPITRDTASKCFIGFFNLFEAIVLIIAKVLKRLKTRKVAVRRYIVVRLRDVVMLRIHQLGEHDSQRNR